MELYDKINSAQIALENLRRATAGAMAAQKIAQRDYEQAQAEADKWERRYQLALKEGREDLAPKAQFQKERYQTIASSLKALVDQQTAKVDPLKRNLTSWESKVSEAQNQVVVCRLNTTSAIDAFERIEDKILQIETPTQAISQQDGANKEIKFITFEENERELAQIKADLLGTQPEHQNRDKQDHEEILEEAIQETWEAVKSAVANQERIQQQYEQARKEASNWHDSAQMALQKDDENLSFKALIAKTVQAKVADAIKIQLEQQQATVQLLKRNLTALETVKHMLEIEAELVDMKAQLLGSATLQKSYLPTATSLSGQVVDGELEYLRSQIDQL